VLLFSTSISFHFHSSLETNLFLYLDFVLYDIIFYVIVNKNLKFDPFL